VNLVRNVATRRRGSLALVVLAALLAWSSCASVAPQSSLERRAQALDRGLICPICPGESLDQSQVALAKQMQGVVREMLADGRTEMEIEDFFVERYGQAVLAAPRKEGFNLIVWVVPPVGALGGLTVLLLVVRAMVRGRRGQEGIMSPDAPESDAGLARYLEIVDRETGAAADVGGPPDGSGEARGGSANG